MLDADVLVYRNDALSVSEAQKLGATHLVISPGPGRPSDAGCSLDMIDAFAGTLLTCEPGRNTIFGYQPRRAGASFAKSSP